MEESSRVLTIKNEFFLIIISAVIGAVIGFISNEIANFKQIREKLNKVQCSCTMI